MSGIKRRHSNSDGSEDAEQQAQKLSRAAKLTTMRGLRTRIGFAKQSIGAWKSISLAEQFGLDKDEAPWFMHLSLGLIPRMLLSVTPSENKPLRSASSVGTVKKTGRAGKVNYVLDFDKLSEIAACSKLTYVLFFTDAEESKRKGATNLWTCLTERLLWREDGRHEAFKFEFLRKFVDNFWFKSFDPPMLTGLEAYLNRFGVGYCEACGMYPNLNCRIKQEQGLIALSAFRLLTEEEKANLPPGYDDTQLIKQALDNEGPIDSGGQTLSKKKKAALLKTREQPEWLKGMLAMRNLFPTRYCCVNCGRIANQQLYGISVASIFEACARRTSNTRNKDRPADPHTSHLWEELEYDLMRPAGDLATDGQRRKEGEAIPGQYEYCYRCGLLRFEASTALAMAEEKCEDCGLLGDKCRCEICEFCRRTPSKCNCIICDRCNLCTSACVKRCEKKGCQCEGSSEEPSFDLSFSEDESDAPSASFGLDED